MLILDNERNTMDNTEFTKEEMQEYLLDQYKEYISFTPMTPYERRLLYKWVASGHSVYTSPGSKYLPDGGSYKSFLEVYRIDRDLSIEMKGMKPAERVSYLKAVTGWVEPTPEEVLDFRARKAANDDVKAYVRVIQRELSHLWDFVWQEGLLDDARAYVDELKDEETFFEW